MFDAFVQDLRFAWRGLMRSPGFAVVAIATLGLGIGANSAIFTVVDAVILRPLPYANPDRLVRVTGDFGAINLSDVGLSPPELADYRDRSGLFESLAGVWPIDANLTEVDEPERIEVVLVSPTYFEVLGARPQLGRLFGPQDGIPGIAELAVISDALWKRHFGGAPDVVGRKVRIDNDWYTITGVLPPGFRHPGRSLLTDVEVWAPAGFTATPFPSPPPRRGYFLTGAIARLRPGITINDARERLEAFGIQLRAQYPDDYPRRSGWAPRMIPLQEDLVGQVRPAMLMLLGAVGFVLLIACANIANLLLARASGRQRELAVRRALGATSGRLMRLMLTESVLLAALGGLVGAGLTTWLVDALLLLVPDGVPRLMEVSVDARVLGFTAAIALGTAVVFGLIPALQFSRVDMQGALKEGGRGVAGGRRVLRSALVVGEFALALVLLVGAGLLIRSFWRLQHVEMGFDARDVVTARLWLPTPNDPSKGRYFQAPARVALYDEILRRARLLPGVQAAAAVQALPLDGTRNTATMTIEGRELDPTTQVAAVQTNIASTGYFELMGIRLVRGRTFTEQDDARVPLVGVVTEAMARRYFAGQDPVGHRVHFGAAQSKSPWITIVGVVADVRTDRLEEAARPGMYQPLRQVSRILLSIVLKTDGTDPSGLGRALAREVRAADPDEPTYGIQTMAALVHKATAARRFATQLLGVFAALALLLAGIGIYGVMAFVVGQRTREIGIRIALGARPQEVVRLVLTQALGLAAGGVVLGAAAAVLMSGLLSGMLFQVRPTDPATYLGIAALLSLTAAVAAWRPARRASRVDPMLALRAE